MIAPVSDADAAAMELDDYGPLEGPMATAGKVFLRSEDWRIATGVWECAAAWMRAIFGNDGEMVDVVKGTIVARGDDRVEQTISPGQSGTFPPHWRGVWTLESPVRKLYCTFNLGQD